MAQWPHYAELEPSRAPESARTREERDMLIASTLYQAQQVLIHAAFAIPTGTYTTARWNELADAVDELAELRPHIRARRD